MKKTFAILATCVAITSVKAVQAEPWQGFYVGALGGANWVNTNRGHRHHRGSFSSSSDFGGRWNRRNKYNTGYAVGGFIGYRWCEGFRLEGEITYRHNKHKHRGNRRRGSSSDFGFRRRFNRSNDHKAVSYMVNALYDFDLSSWDCGCDWGLTPYLGVGIGYSHEQGGRHHRRRRFSSSSFSSSHRRRHHGHRNRGGFAWQIIAGASYCLTPCLDLALEYRFHRTNNRRGHHSRRGSSGRFFRNDDNRGRNFSNNTLDVAIRYHF